MITTMPPPTDNRRKRTFGCIAPAQGKTYQGMTYARRLRDSAAGGRVTRHTKQVRLSQFWTLMDDEFGPAYAPVLADRHVLSLLAGRTVSEALDAGVPPRQVWEALCDAMDVPPDRWLGRDLPAVAPSSELD